VANDLRLHREHYRATVTPPFQFYDRQGVLLQEIDAAADVEAVSEAVLSELGRHGGGCDPKPDRSTVSDETRR
jgi:hypothetical protein